MLEILWLAIGLAGLWIGSDFIIKSAENVALKFKISPFFIGLVLVSIGTSIPEIAVSITGGVGRLSGFETSGLVIGTMLGSSINQITLLIGLLALFVVLKMNKKETLVHGGVLSASVLLFYIFASDGKLSHLEGWIMIVSYGIYVAYLVSKENIIQKFKYNNKKESNGIYKDLFYLILGLVIITYGSDLVVNSGVKLAEALGVRQSLIGILLVGLGTGLPELSVTIAGARRKIMDIPMGMLVGSNICDILLSVGTGTVISSFLVDNILLWFDLPVLLLFTFIFTYFLWTKSRLSKKEGLILLGLYLVYAIVKVTITG